MAPKKIVGNVKLQIAAGKATPAPPVGPALGQHGVNIMEFCKQFNAKTAEMNLKPGLIVPVVLTIYADRSFTFVVKTPPASVLIKEACGLEKASANSKKIIAAEISIEEITAIAQRKMPDLNAASIESATSMIMGTARSMGVAIKGMAKKK